MSTLWKFITSILLLIVFVVITGFVVSTIPANKRIITRYRGEIIMPDLISDVTIYRDSRGMPHIYAENEHDVYFAAGFTMGQERLWQMDLIRRTTTGRLSEIFGRDYVQTDLFLRSLNISRKSKIVLEKEDPEILECLQAYADGVNACIDAMGRKLPPEFKILSYKPEPWRLEDIANIGGYIGWTLGISNLSSELFNFRLIQKLGPEKAIGLSPDFETATNCVFPDFEQYDELIDSVQAFIASVDKLKELGISFFSGSNNWAVSGFRTSTGKPILSNDMHLPISSPGIWMQMHLNIPGKLNVTGVAIPGQPLIIAGHNESIAWGLTNMKVDDIDLYAEKINPDNANQYLFNGEWLDMTIRDEIIKIKGGRSDTLSLRFTHRGPVISGFENVQDACLSMKWSGFDFSDEIRSVYLLNRASNWNEFRSALSHFRSISQNFAYADTAGNIGINAGGGIPIRKMNGNFIKNGETGEFDWQGYVPFNELPSYYNPVAGYVSSANNKTVNEDYPYYIGNDFALPYRINRIRQMLSEKEIFSIDDLKMMINDMHSDYAALLTPFILRISERSGDLSPLEKTALDTLSNWDYEMKTGIVAPTIFEYFRKSFIKNLVEDEMGEFFDQLYETNREYYIYNILKKGPDELVDNIITPVIETLDDIIFISYKDCIKSLMKEAGTSMSGWKWGKFHKISLKHPMGSVKILNWLFELNSEKYKVGGSDHTVCPFYYYESGPSVLVGASERHIFNTANWDESYTIIPDGNSGIPSSEFYLSQTKNYFNGEFYKDPFSDEAVKEDIKYTLKLLPGR